MLKKLEVSSPDSCLNKAEDDEPIFVLRAKDDCAPEAILAWIQHRLRKGRNKVGDVKMTEALLLAADMQKWRDKHVGGRDAGDVH